MSCLLAKWKFYKLVLETTLPQSHDEASNHSETVVPLPEPGDKVTTSQESPWLLSEHLPALVSLSIPHSLETVTVTGLSDVRI